MLRKKTCFCFFLSFILSLFLVQCGGGGTPEESSSSSSFPEDLAITSPTDVENGGSGSISLSQSAGGAISFASSYEAATEDINTLLTATSLADCAPTLSALFDQSANASCYGPALDYVNHPDGTDQPLPELPSGDTGIWSATEGSSSEACASSQLNSKMADVQGQTTAALLILASQICTINNTSGLSLPSAGTTLTMTDEINDMLTAAGLSDEATANSSTLTATSNSAGTTDYSYSNNLTFTAPPGSPVTEVTIQVDMTHRPLDATNSTYRGKFSYSYASSDSLGNCFRDFGGLSTSDITEIGSVEYDLSSSTSLKFDARHAQTCGSNNTAPLVDGVLDPSVKASTGPTPSLEGWAANFSTFNAEFSPTTGVGNYVYQWQAGSGDGTARTFNLVLADANSDGNLEGDAFFGYADDMEDTDGSILGIYCNWAGPEGGVGNQTSKRSTLAQYQEIDQDGTGLFTATTSNILYAPVLDCDLDQTDIDSGFNYDLDGNGALDDTLTAFENDLVDPTTAVPASGFSLPTAPTSI